VGSRAGLDTVAKRKITRNCCDSRQPTMDGPPTLGLYEGLITHHLKKVAYYEMLHTMPRALWALVNTAVNLRVPLKAKDLLKDSTHCSRCSYIVECFFETNYQNLKLTSFYIAKAHAKNGWKDVNV
jgi:hypothetical protein